jgi:hypothetical protein
VYKHYSIDTAADTALRGVAYGNAPIGCETSYTGPIVHRKTNAVVKLQVKRECKFGGFPEPFPGGLLPLLLPLVSPTFADIANAIAGPAVRTFVAKSITET